MLMNNYEVEYEVSFKIFHVVWLLLPWLLLFGGIAIFRRPRSGKSIVLQKLLGAYVALFSVAILWVAFRAVIGDYRNRKTQLRTGHYHTVEGRVEHFVPMPYQGHALEKFDVQGVRFSYGTYMVTSCFNHTTSHGGPIYEGLQVRIAYAPTGNGSEQNCILKLEVATVPLTGSHPR